MKSIYITSVDTFSGKTALTLVLGKYLKTKGHSLGYLKPLSFQPRWTGGKITDEDAAYAKEVLGLTAEPWDLSPVVVTTDFLLERLQIANSQDLIEKIKAKAKLLSEGVDVMLYEGGGSLREGYAIGLPTTVVAQELGSPALAVVKYRDKVHLLDDAITREVPVLERGQSMIKLLASVAPLLGLLGTVTGMIATFQSISLFGTGDPKLMASGISQALITTMLGLIVAIPLLFLHSLIASRSRKLVQILDEQSAGLISRRMGK